MVSTLANNISIITYGRAVKSYDSWNFAETLGVNRLYYIHSGKAVFTSGETTLELEEGKVYLFPQNIEFNMRAMPGNDVDHSFYDFYLPTCTSTQVIKIDRSEPLIDLTLKALLEIADNHPMFPILSRNEYYNCAAFYLANLLFLISKHSKKLSFINDKRLTQALTYIKNNICTPMTVDDIAKNVHLNTNYFIKLFKNEMHISPYQYIKNYRLNIAISLLQSGLSIAEVMELVGYESTSNFTKAIKKYTGLTPAALKNEIDTM